MLSGNPARYARENAAAYVKQLMDLLGDRDPFAVQSEQTGWLAAAVAGIDDATLRRPEKPGKWSILQVVQHLADSEMITAYRMRMIVAHPTPEIQGYDQDLWADRLKYNEVNLSDAFDQHRILRAANLRFLSSLSDEEMAREGLHSERGPESVRKMMQMIAGHDILHRNQIMRIKRAIGLL